MKQVPDRPLVPASLVLLALLTVSASPSHGATFEVTPLRFSFSAAKGSDILNIKNESEGNLQVQIKAYEWTQDAEGKDNYAETKDVIFFPRILSLKQSEGRIVRVGMKGPPGKREKTYRMYLEEIPGKEALQGTTVRTLLRIGIPVFFAPVAPEAKGNLEGLKTESGGKVSFLIKNEGNVHFIIRSIKITGQDASGSEVFADESQGWYLHAGVAKAFTREIPKNECPKVRRINVEVTTDKPTLSGALDVQQGICTP
jgi:fimbrial chaperone protein